MNWANMYWPHNNVQQHNVHTQSKPFRWCDIELGFCVTAHHTYAFCENLCGTCCSRFACFFPLATAVTVCVDLNFSARGRIVLRFDLAFSEHSCTLQMARHTENESPKMVESVLVFKRRCHCVCIWISLSCSS